MKKLSYLGIILPFLLLALAACSENDNPTGDPILGYKLDQFISADSVQNAVDPGAEEPADLRSLFACEIVSGEDGFSPRASSYAGYDLPWETFAAGYLVPSDSYRTWFPDAGLPGAFKVRDTGLFRLYRKVDVNCGTGSKLVELRGLSLYPTENWNGAEEDAIRLADLLQGIAAYDSVRFEAADGYAKTYVPSQINEGYYLLDSEVTTFPALNDDLPGSVKKFKKLASLQVYGASEQVFSFDLAPLEEADFVFTVPSDLGAYESTELLAE